MLNALTSFVMQPGFKKLTLELPEDFHENLRRFCFDNKTTMKEIVSELLAQRFHWPMPKFVDRRKLTMAQREAYDAGPSAASSRHAADPAPGKVRKGKG